MVVPEKYDFGDLVEAKVDLTFAPKGSIGVVWGVYGGEPPSYEACWIVDGKPEDDFFAENQVSAVVTVSGHRWEREVLELRAFLVEHCR